MARSGNAADPLGKGVAGYYGVRQSIADEIQAFQEAGGVQGNAFAALPAPSPRGLNARSGAFIEGYAVFNDLTGEVSGRTKYDLNAMNMGYDVTAGDFYKQPYINAANPLMPRYQNLAGQLPGSGAALDRADGPAALSVVPTSTSNLHRPRTVAAGWQENPDTPDVGKLTVVFRDGTYYNYYDVTKSEWDRFKSAPSKGPMLNPRPTPGFLMYKSRGEATVDFMSQQAQETQFRVAMAAQQVYQSDSEAKQGLKAGRAGRPRKGNSTAGATNPANRRKK